MKKEGSPSRRAGWEAWRSAVSGYCWEDRVVMLKATVICVWCFVQVQCNHGDRLPSFFSVELIPHSSIYVYTTLTSPLPTTQPLLGWTEETLERDSIWNLDTRVKGLSPVSASVLSVWSWISLSASGSLRLLICKMKIKCFLPHRVMGAQTPSPVGKSSVNSQELTCYPVKRDLRNPESQ